MVASFYIVCMKRVVYECTYIVCVACSIYVRHLECVVVGKR